VPKKESKFMKLYNLAGNAIMINLFFLICSVPIVTMGASWCGIFSAVRYAIRQDGWASGFKEGLCRRFLRMTVAWVVCLIVDVYMILNLWTMFYYKVDGWVVQAVFHSIFLLIALMLTASLMILNVYIPTSVVQWLKNAITLTFTSPIRMAIFALLMWLPVVVFVAFGFESFYLIMLFAAVYFSFIGLVGSVLLTKPLVKIKKEMSAMGALTPGKDEYMPNPDGEQDSEDEE